MELKWRKQSRGEDVAKRSSKHLKMKGAEFLVAATTFLLLAFVTAVSSQELDDYVDRDAISEAADDFKGKLMKIISFGVSRKCVLMSFPPPRLNSFTNFFNLSFHTTTWLLNKLMTIHVLLGTNIYPTTSPHHLARESANPPDAKSSLLCNDL